MTRKAIYPGTFDPVTYGHLDIIERASILYDKVLVAVATGSKKKPLFTAKERVGMLKEETGAFGNVEVEEFNELVVDYAGRKSAKVIIRGLRMISDFEYEFQMALTNRKLNPNIETVFMMPKESYSYLSSRLIKEVAGLDANISAFVSQNVENKLKEKFRR